MEIQTLTGTLIEIQDRKTKKNNKPYQLIKLEGNKDGFFDWDGIVTNQFSAGDDVTITYSPGQYPKLHNIKLNKKGVMKVLEPKAKPKQMTSALANTAEYLALKLAVELVKDETIQVDEKVKRVSEAYSDFLNKLGGS